MSGVCFEPFTAVLVWSINVNNATISLTFIGECGVLLRTAVGCMDPEDDTLPAATSLERSTRDKHLALVRCQSSDESWQVTCQHGVWSLENVGNCSTTRPQVEGTVSLTPAHQHWTWQRTDRLAPPTSYQTQTEFLSRFFFTKFSRDLQRADGECSLYWAINSRNQMPNLRDSALLVMH